MQLQNKIFLYNTESQEKEELKISDGKTFRMYTCGPTVYNYAHIGNFRTYVAEDLLRRTLEYFGYPVNHVMNITDIDDKTIRGALANKISLKAFTEPFRIAFLEDLKTLKTLPARTYPQATAYISEMIEIIQKLLDEGVAYPGGDGSVYFAVDKFPSYGRLSHLDRSSLVAGASGRIDADEYEKGNISDFALWKGYKEEDGNIFWDSPFGKGRPGWHIECSAMASKLLGHQIDLHAGGVDNMFPHHENEIAQSEASCGCQFANHWMHIEHLLVDGQKMSKSAGNFYTLRDILGMGFSGRVMRYCLLKTHYRIQLNFRLDELAGAKAALDRFDHFRERLEEAAGNPKCDSENDKEIKACEAAFQEALSDDLNISKALAVLFDFLRVMNGRIDKGKVSVKARFDVLELLKRLDVVLGVIFADEEKIPADIMKLFEDRLNARKNKDYTESDRLRFLLEDLGYLVEDKSQKSTIRKK